MKSWVEVSADSHFPIENLPYCVFSYYRESPRVGVGIGSYVLDLSFLYNAGILPKGLAPHNVFALSALNDFVSQGRQIWTELRKCLIELLEEGNALIRDDEELLSKSLHKQSDVVFHHPMRIGAFVDFYSSEQHATNVGKMLRPDSPLMPNWKHLPVGYNGRASSVVVSGTPIHRPNGQTMPQDAETPIYGPSRNLDFELEVGFFTGKANPLGQQVSTAEAEDYIFGMVLVNDWSARDIQKWEYQPLGPFLAKSFATTISPWVVTMEALEPFRVSGGTQNPAVLPYLQCDRPWAYDINLEVLLKSEKMSRPQTICRTNYKNMYWNMAQQLAHQCVNGTNVQVGDLYASGTVSGDTPDSYGSMLELAWRGEKPITLAETGEQRKYVDDGDEITLTGWCQGDGFRVGFGEAAGVILPSMAIE
ncbi:MAG: fumarylacetoacetase [Fimbriimonadales bacterium]